MMEALAKNKPQRSSDGGEDPRLLTCLCTGLQCQGYHVKEHSIANASYYYFGLFLWVSPPQTVRRC